MIELMTEQIEFKVGSWYLSGGQYFIYDQIGLFTNLETGTQFEQLKEVQRVKLVTCRVQVLCTKKSESIIMGECNFRSLEDGCWFYYEGSAYVKVGSKGVNMLNGCVIQPDGWVLELVVLECKVRRA